MNFSRVGPRRRKCFVTIFPAILLALLLWSLSRTAIGPTLFWSHKQDIPITVVVAAVKRDNLTLLGQDYGISLGDKHIVYVVDDPNAAYHVPMNKGNEAMVYLSFLIDNYNSLPELMVFMHAGRTSWHNNALFHLESAPMIRHLRRSYIRENGFVNLLCDQSRRCTNVFRATDSGYPASILTRERVDPQEDPAHQYAKFHTIWGAIFPGQPIPPTLGTVPGAQFSLTRETAQKVPLEELKRFRQWIIDVDLGAKEAGGVFERIWHMIFLGTSHSVLCPIPHECYCSLYGICFGSISSNPEILMEETTQSGYDLHVMSERLDRIRQVQHLDITTYTARDSELESLSNGQIGPGLAGLSDYTVTLERNITELTHQLDELVRRASMPDQTGTYH